MHSSEMPNADASDDGLAAALAAGDHKRATEILVGLHGDYIYGYCRWMLGNTADAEEVSQIAFMSAYRDLGHLSCADNARIWLRGIARHRCLDRLRTSQRGPELVDDGTLHALAELPSCVAPPDSDPRADKLLLESLDAGLDCLDARSRMLLIWVYHDGLSFAEISQLSSDTEGALRVRKTRALKTLRRVLERQRDAADALRNAALRNAHGGGPERARRRG